jgi:hypothetical protein
VLRAKSNVTGFEPVTLTSLCLLSGFGLCLFEHDEKAFRVDRQICGGVRILVK